MFHKDSEVKNLKGDIIACIIIIKIKKLLFGYIKIIKFTSECMSTIHKKMLDVLHKFSSDNSDGFLYIEDVC